MSSNNLQDAGVKWLSEGLQNTNCELNKLSVSECSIGEEGYKSLCSAVRSNPESHLIDLDLRGNDPGETGVKLIYQLTQDHKCSLKTVRFLSSSSAVKAFEYLTEALGINPLLEREVNLSDHKLDESRVNQICDLLKDKHCRINTLILSKNKLEDSGMKKISDLLRHSQCRLHKLNVSECSIGEEGYKSLCSAVRSNPKSHLIDLDLRGNDPGETGVKLIYQLTQDHKCSLKTVRFLSSSSAVKAFEYLTEALGINPLLEREVNLSDHKLDESRVNQICDLLKDKHCRINTLILSKNKLEDSGMKKISDLLRHSQCRLHKLNVSECSIGEEGYKSLCSAVRSNPESHLIDLDLRGNDPGETGVKLIYQLTQDHKCSLKTVRFLKSCAAEEACDYLCKALDVYPLLLKELNLSHNKLGDLDGEKLSALLMDSHSKVTKIILNNCELTENQCSALAAVLSCKTLVKEMNLNNSRLMDSGLKHICDKLKNPQCHLQILNVSECSIGEEGYKSLCSAVRSNPSHLIDLDLRGNDPGETGVKLIYQLTQDQTCSLKTVRFLSSSSAVKAFEYLTEALGINPLLEREVNLSDHKLDESRVNQICDLLKDKHCRINTLILSKNKLEDSGMKKISDLLRHSQCRLHKLNVSECSIGEEGYKSLCSAVRSNPESHLIDLDLRGNDPGETGVKLIYQLTQDHKCSLKTVRFLKSCAAEEACDYLCKALDVYPLLLKELNLSHNKLGDLDGEKLSALLMDSHSKVTKIILNNCELTENQCSALAAVLSCKTLVKEMNLNNSRLMDSGLKHICDKLKNPQCHLQILNLSYCSIGEEGYKSLCSAVRSNPKSRLIDLDLRGNDPGETGVKLIYQLTQDHKCSLKTVRFLKRDAALKAFEYLHIDIGLNPSLQGEVDLSDHKLHSSTLKQICLLLEDKPCKLNKLMLTQCGLTEDGLRSNPTRLRHLNLSGRKLGDSGVRFLCFLLGNYLFKPGTMELCECSITEAQCVQLISALCLNLSQLTHLNLSQNKLGHSGIKRLCDLLKHSDCKLDQLELRACGLTDEGLVALTSALSSNPSHLRQLDLSGNPLGDSGVKHLCALLSNSQCSLETLHLRWCNITDATALADTLAQTQALRFLRVLELSNNKIKELKQLRAVLKGSSCELILLPFWGAFWGTFWGSFWHSALWTVQSSSDEEDGDTSSQNVKPKDEV
ncbi:uncharacterized protein LOC130549384 isoform X3 [Triplophysa rosa]|uniref:uncharacterized protein LOC130549384 isoform X3 n=1 Tax=Triplophysa rosa TaxID=992332 RepID=UPI002545C91D|nr:uncharacterized protein LOC130549384 isoform X3 [Triplophysa rosa]